MAGNFRHFSVRISPLNKLSLVVGIVGLLLMSHCGEASPRPKVVKSGHSGSRTSRSASNYSMGTPAERQSDFNSTLDGNDGRLCSVGDSDRPACRKAGLDMKRISLELIKQDILKKLRLDENKLPNGTAQNFPIPAGLLSEFVGIDMQGDSPQRDDTYDDEHATTEKIITFSKSEAIPGKPGKNLLHFSFSEKMSNMKIESATLYVHVEYLRNHHHTAADQRNSNFNIKIMELIQSIEGESPVHIDYGTFKPIYRKNGDGSNGMPQVRHNRSKWVELDIRETLSKWVATSVSSSSRKISLVIEAVDQSGNRSQKVAVVSSDANTYPFIEVHVSEGGRRRQQRNIGMTCDENSQETKCCKYPLTVDFDEFGWDWIIAPKKYDANYCSGECPYAFLQKYPHNHIVQQAVPSGIGGPCCAARKMSSISMLYFDGDSNIVYSVLPGMVVEKCGCS